jgi:hypothetical protein
MFLVRIRRRAIKRGNNTDFFCVFLWVWRREHTEEMIMKFTVFLGFWVRRI